MRVGSKAVPAAICPAIVRVATRMPSRPRSAPSVVAADRRAALPSETVARAGIGGSAKPPPGDDHRAESCRLHRRGGFLGHDYGADDVDRVSLLQMAHRRTQ